MHQLQLFKALGYSKVTLTPSSNDKGVDVLAEYQGIKVAIQCKKYKGLVGSPQIQTFLGAMRHAEAQKGFFITTSVFSIEAEKMASAHLNKICYNFERRQAHAYQRESGPS